MPWGFNLLRLHWVAGIQGGWAELLLTLKVSYGIGGGCGWGIQSTWAPTMWVWIMMRMMERMEVGNLLALNVCVCITQHSYLKPTPCLLNFDRCTYICGFKCTMVVRNRIRFAVEPDIFLLNCTHAHPCYSNCTHVFKNCAHVFKNRVMWNWSEENAITIRAVMFCMKCMHFKCLDGTY